MAIQFTFKGVGTSWIIDIHEDVLEEEEILEKIQNRIELFEKSYSRFREDSLVAQISKNAGKYSFPDDSRPMFSLYKELYDITGGLMTPLIGQMLIDTGYDSKYSLVAKKEIQNVKKWEEVMYFSDNILKVRRPIQLDFGAMGKGYLIDIVAGTLVENNISNYTINAGGDIAYKTTNNKVLRVGLENPENLKEVVGVIEIMNKSICGSAGSRRAWGKYHHIINPETIESPRHILALWVVADSTILADALATALFFVGPSKLRDKYKFEYAILYEDHTVGVSEDFPGTFFT